ncbi:MAG: DUF342 domain-containing protein [Desulfobacteraceae bacterium]|nr:DUF342 domain-containing protein [Desulfobacteraceae bacterium]
MAVVGTVQKTRKDKKILMLVNIAHTLKYISKKTAGQILRQYKKFGDEFKPTSYMLDKQFINNQKLISLKKCMHAFETIQDDTRFGSLCISFGFLTSSNLEIALMEQALLIEQGENIKLGNLLIRAGMISKGEAKIVLVKQKANLQIINKSSKTDSNNGSTSRLNKKNMKEIHEDSLIFFIRYDALMVYLRKAESFDPATTLDELKQIITNQEIIHGVAKDEKLQEFLDSDEYLEDNYFELAQGDPAVDGTDATEKIYFEKEYKEAGKVGIDGSIDYRERGTVPAVKVDDLIAEKIPSQKGESGLNVYDEIISPETPGEILLKTGPGTRISEDGLKIYAEVDGYPKKEISGEIVVNEVFAIEGDVDYKTGNINYDKSVYIEGSIKNGFKVNAIDIVVDEVDGGILHAKGDVIVRKGIIDGEIKATGKITASYILRSKVSCFGDIEVIKEISDSEVLSDGKCRVRVGKVFASSISAKRGADIRNIGTEKAKKMIVTVGTSPNYDKKLDKIDKMIEDSQNELEQATYEKNNAQNEIKEIITVVSDLSASLEKTQTMIEKISNTNKNGVDMLKENIDDKNKKLAKLEIKKNELESKLEKFQDAEAECSKLVKEGITEKFTLKKIDQDKPPKPIVKAEGTIVAGTQISGRYSKTIISENKTRVKIMEIQMAENESSSSRKSSWAMVTSDL